MDPSRSEASRDWLFGLTLRRRAFFAFAVTLFALTHWPALQVSVPGIERPDLILHFAFFATWYLLLFAAGLFGPLGRPRSLLWPWTVAIGYAAVDEALQAVPIIRRHAAWDDWLANVGGITIGLLVATIWTRVRGRRFPFPAGEQSRP